MKKSIKPQIETTEVVSKLKPTSRITFYPLIRRCEDGIYIVGRVETGEFISLPEVGIQVIDNLQDKYNLQESTSLVMDNFGIEIDISTFIEELANLGFIKEIDGFSIYVSQPKLFNFNWLKPQYIYFLFGRTATICYMILVTIAFITLIKNPQLVPSYQDFFWASSTSLVLAGNTAITIGNIALHELAHLAAARSLDLPVRISLSTRLHNLVVQTDVSSLWSVPRRYRYRVYLAGIVWELIFCSTALIVLAYIPLISLVKGLIKALILTQFFGITWQFYFYMRTDIYFVIQDLLRCHNLFTDSLNYLKFCVQKTNRLVFKKRFEKSIVNPLINVPIQEKKKIIAYSWLVLIGSLISLCVFFTYNLPILIKLLIQACISIWNGIVLWRPKQFLDGLITLLIEGSIQLVFIITILKRYKNHRLSRAKRVSAEIPAKRDTL
ncbi:hypothetical protein A4S05_32095 [Nostoc sp. KVJ20]|uniref:hypothetical protein n=1 Tax=Nostoc sp. KVJ20 TaxID=457944 RepID=UPI00083D8C6A|nr:hypothetical protein [Nostoc sp. KVJ20]ODH00731.1 hypothetical protein A4S05_32095 [Nostoc sp. KVJ20]